MYITREEKSRFKQKSISNEYVTIWGENQPMRQHAFQPKLKFNSEICPSKTVLRDFYFFLLLRQVPRFMFFLPSPKLTVYHKLTNLLTNSTKEFTDKNLSHIHGLKESGRSKPFWGCCFFSPLLFSSCHLHAMKEKSNSWNWTNFPTLQFLKGDRHWQKSTSPEVICVEAEKMPNSASQRHF